MCDHAANLRRLMAKLDLKVEDVVERSKLSARTVRAFLAGERRPHSRTLHRLAAGLGVSTDEFFQDPSLLTHQLFDRDTNPVVDQIVAEHPKLFTGWTEGDFDELYSRFGTGGALTAEGTRTVVHEMNRNRSIRDRVDVLLESSEAELLIGVVELLYQRIAVSDP